MILTIVFISSAIQHFDAIKRHFDMQKHISECQKRGFVVVDLNMSDKKLSLSFEDRKKSWKLNLQH